MDSINIFSLLVCGVAIVLYTIYLSSLVKIFKNRKEYRKNRRIYFKHIKRAHPNIKSITEHTECIVLRDKDSNIVMEMTYKEVLGLYHGQSQATK